MFDRGDYEKALYYFRESDKIIKNDVTTVVNIATCLAKLDRFDEALEYYEIGARFESHLGQYYNWGAILEYRGDYAKAIEVFHNASTYSSEGGRLTLYQDDHAMKAVSAMHEGTLLCRTGDSQGGVDAFKYAVSIDNNLGTSGWRGWLSRRRDLARKQFTLS